MSDNQNNNPKGIIIGMLCLIWGLGSIAAMLFCSKLENHTGILLVLLGQFFSCDRLDRCNLQQKSQTISIYCIGISACRDCIACMWNLYLDKRRDCFVDAGSICTIHIDLDIPACRDNDDSRYAWENPVPEAGMYAGGSGKMRRY